MGVSLAGQPRILSSENSFTELALLANTADLEGQGDLTHRLQHSHPAAFFGANKLV